MLNELAFHYPDEYLAYLERIRECQVVQQIAQDWLDGLHGSG